MNGVINILKHTFYYSVEMIRIYLFNFWHKFNNKHLLTYRPDDNFIRCRRCGRDIHDFIIPNEIWNQVAKPNDCFCYDCFCDLYEKKTGQIWRMNQ